MRDFVDRLGIWLSLLCAVHCLVVPLIILSLPILARYYLMHPFFHWGVALLILPVGIYAFVSGYRIHRNPRVFYLGIPGLFFVGLVPVFFHSMLSAQTEPLIISLGSVLLVCAHWINRRSCSCEAHGH